PAPGTALATFPGPAQSNPPHHPSYSRRIGVSPPRTARCIMPRIRTPLFLTMLLITLRAPQPGDQPQGGRAALEQKLHGAWKGGACVGDYTFHPDGMFVLNHFTPGNSTVT